MEPMHHLSTYDQRLKDGWGSDSNVPSKTATLGVPKLHDYWGRSFG